MSEFDKGVVAGILITLITIIVIVLAYGCVNPVIPEPERLRKESILVPDRPPLPEGWRSEGNLWINDITRDTI